MASLTDQSVASSYEQLLHVDRDGGGNGSTLVDVKDGDNGTTFALKLATDNVKITGDADLDSNYIVNEQGRQNHVANTMSSPYYRFDGVDDYVEIADTDNLSFVSGGFTFSAWVYIEDKQFFPFFGKGDVSTNWEYLFRTDTDGKFQVYVSDFGSSAFWQVAGTNVLPENKWIHVAITYDGGDASSSFKLYLNGASETVASATESGSYVAIENLDQPVRIGRYSTTYGQGQIACVRAYNTPLTADEIKIEYSGSSVPYKYKGANQTDIASFDFTSSWSNSSGASVVDSNSFSVSASNGQGIYKALLTVGKRYRLVLAGTMPGSMVMSVRNSAGGGNEIGSGFGTYEFTATDTSIYLRVSGATGQIDISTFTIVQIGAVAEYMGSGIASDKWLDASGNDLHGTVSGASVENAPSDDDGLVYEEGTWTGVFKDTSGNAVTMASGYTTGAYKRVGNLVTVSGYFIANGLGSASGSIKLTGLPFTAKTGEEYYSGGSVGYAQGLAITAGHSVTISVAASTEISIRTFSTSAGTSNLTEAGLTADGGIIIGLTYCI